jgi:hypothetical protein
LKANIIEDVEESDESYNTEENRDIDNEKNKENENGNDNSDENNENNKENEKGYGTSDENKGNNNENGNDNSDTNKENNQIFNDIIKGFLDSIIFSTIFENKDFTIMEDDITYQMISSNNTQDLYNNVSSINLGDCEKNLNNIII